MCCYDSRGETHSRRSAPILWRAPARLKQRVPGSHTNESCCMRRCPQCYNINASVVDVDWTNVSGGGPAFPDCCFAAKVRVPSTDAGRFSVLVKEQETTVEAVRLWNPGCALCSAPCSFVILIPCPCPCPCHIETLTPLSAAVRTTAAPTSSMETNPVSRDPM
eukprot:2862762-Prymnesium_polylepis.1